MVRIVVGACPSAHAISPGRSRLMRACCLTLQTTHRVSQRDTPARRAHGRAVAGYLGQSLAITGRTSTDHLRAFGMRAAQSIAASSDSTWSALSAVSARYSRGSEPGAQAGSPDANTTRWIAACSPGCPTLREPGE